MLSYLYIYICIFLIELFYNYTSMFVAELNGTHCIWTKTVMAYSIAAHFAQKLVPISVIM